MAYCEKKTAEPVIPAAAYVLTLNRGRSAAGVGGLSVTHRSGACRGSARSGDRVVTPEDKDINGLAFHLADVCGARWERLGPREQAIYRAAAKAGVAAARLIFEAEVEGVQHVG